MFSRQGSKAEQIQENERICKILDRIFNFNTKIVEVRWQEKNIKQRKQKMNAGLVVKPNILKLQDFKGLLGIMKKIYYKCHNVQPNIIYQDLIIFAKMFEETQLFNVLDLNPQQPSIKVPSRKVLRMRAIKESYKALRNNSDFDFLQDHIKYYAASQNVNMANFMKVWILLEKYSKLDSASSALKSHIKLLSKESNNPVLPHISFLRSILDQTDLKSAYDLCWQRQNKGKDFNKGLSELNRYRKQIRSKQIN